MNTTHQKLVKGAWLQVISSTTADFVITNNSDHPVLFAARTAAGAPGITDADLKNAHHLLPDGLIHRSMFPDSLIYMWGDGTDLGVTQ